MRSYEMWNHTFSSGMAEKDPTEKSGFDFTGGAVLTEGLGGGAGQYEMWNRLFSSGMAEKDPTEKDSFAFSDETF